MIGIPIVTKYGSSYGTFNGARLSDYSNPDSNGVDRNKLATTDTGEYKQFDREIKDYVYGMLGFPVIKVELTDFQIKLCIDEAVSKLEYHAPMWMTQYAVFNTSASVNVYELPPAIMNNLTDVWYKKNLFTLGATPGSLEYDFAIMFFTNTGLFNNYNVSQYMLMQMYLKQISKVLGMGSSWNIVNGKYLQLYPVPDSSESVIIEFRAMDPETIHPMYKNWIQRYSLACAKGILGKVRGKFKTLPGPSGGSQLDGETLTRESADEKEKLEQELFEAIGGPPLFDLR